MSKKPKDLCLSCANAEYTDEKNEVILTCTKLKLITMAIRDKDMMLACDQYVKLPFFTRVLGIKKRRGIQSDTSP